LIVSTADEWDLTVPEDAAELLAELRRHGVQPGQRLHVARVREMRVARGKPVSRSAISGRYSSRSAKDSVDEAPAAEQPRRRLDFIGSIHGGPSDLSAKTDDYLARGFGRD
jgi:hypothetical protein